jgi:hypothetical protein
MSILVPSGHTVLSDEERAGVPPKLLDFTFTLGTMYVYEKVLKKKVEDWTPATEDGVNTEAILEMLYAGLYNIDDPGKSLTIGQIGAMCPLRSIPALAIMVGKVMNESSALPSEDEIKNADPNGSGP